VFGVLLISLLAAMEVFSFFLKQHTSSKIRGSPPVDPVSVLIGGWVAIAGDFVVTSILKWVPTAPAAVTPAVAPAVAVIVI
jgi:hypothetical protein